MSGESDTARQSQITTDPDTIRHWGETYDVVPVRYEEAGESHLALVHESALEDRHDRLDWGDFEADMREHDVVVVRHEDEEVLDVVDRTEVVGHAAVTSEEVEESLLEGETIESEFTERAVVERTIVEEVTVESEVADRELIESDTVDVDLASRDVEDCQVTNVDMEHGGIEALDTFGTSTRTDVACDVEVTLDEAWTVTKENVERVTIESHVVETDVEETDTLESDTVQETVDLAGVERTVLQGELVESPHAAERAIEEGHVESQFRADDTIETHLIRTQVVEEDVSVRRLVSGEITDAETLTSETISHEAIESDIAEPTEYDTDLAVERESAGVEDTSSLEGDEPATTAETVAADETMATGEATPTDDDEGKTVVNASGDEIGMVAAVEEGQLYVDPHPSLTDRIRTALGWSAQEDEDTYPVDNDNITRIEDDEVVLGVDRGG